MLARPQGPRALLYCALAAALAGPVLAEPEHSGSWRARFSAGGDPREATLRVDVAAGTWTLLPQAAAQGRLRDGCAGRALPARLRGSGSSTVTLFIDASRVDPRCRDRSARLTVVDTDTLEGEFDDGSVVRLERVDP